ncbi:MAG: ABC transporter permease [Streptosporangiaceae bacterium]|nr:ABC transporter permease [Streptosporangiaceae bacterium]
MNGFAKLTLVETRLFLREKVALLGVFAVPIGLVVGFGLIPGFGKAQKSLSGQIGTEFIGALGISIVLISLGLQGIPMVVAQYRERGILRRLGVTPVRPLTLLVAKLAVYAAAAAVSAAIIISVARLAYHVPVPVKAAWFVASFVLGMTALFSLGMLVSAVMPTARSAMGVAMALFFPNMFLAGIYFPTENMSPGMRQAGNFTPLGSAFHAIRDSWMGIDPRLEYLGIMAAWTLAATILAARFFRWDRA